MFAHKYFTKKERQEGIGDFNYRKKEWALKAQRVAKKKDFKATLHGSRGHWEVRVRR